MLNAKISDGRITENFWLFEIKSKGNGEILINPDVIEHAQRLQEFRNWYKRAMPVNSWYRDVIHNKNEGGASNSQHLIGVATDIALPSIFFTMPKERQNEYLFNCYRKWILLGGRGFGMYDTFMHMDSRKRGTWFEDKRTK